MKKWLGILVLLAALLKPLGRPLIAQEYPYTGNEIPPGMEVIEDSGGYRLIVPKGSKTRKIGAQILVEGTKEYTARMMDELFERIALIEKRLTDLMEDYGSLADQSAEQQDDEARLTRELENLKNEMSSLKIRMNELDNTPSPAQDDVLETK